MRYVSACAADEIPVIAPLAFPAGGTLGEADGIFFALFPKRGGRPIELFDVDPEAAEHWPWAVTADTAAALWAKAGAR